MGATCFPQTSNLKACDHSEFIQQLGADLGSEFGAVLCHRGCARPGHGFAALEKLEGVKERRCKPSQSGVGCAMAGTASHPLRYKDRPLDCKRMGILVQIFPTKEASPFPPFQRCWKNPENISEVPSEPPSAQTHTALRRVCFSDLSNFLTFPLPPSLHLRILHSTDPVARLDPFYPSPSLVWKMIIKQN